MRSLAYHRPTSLAEALRLKREIPGSAFIAGGTDVMVKIKGGERRPEALISLRALGELEGITHGATTRIGALTSMSTLLESAEIRAAFPALAQAVARLGSVQIRNAASLGGNLCSASPCADSAPPLLVYEARAEILGAAGTREMPLEDFFVGPGETVLGEDEILAAIHVDVPAPTTRAAFRGKSRVGMDLTLASVACLFETQGGICRRARVAAGAVAPVPLRLKRTEALLEGETITPELAREAGELSRTEITPICDVRASAEYRSQIVGVYVQRAILRALDGGAA